MGAAAPDGAELAQALVATPARRIVALNLVAQPGETEGFSPQTHLEVLADHAPQLKMDIVLADRGAAGGATAELEKAAGLLGGRLVLADLAMRDGTPRHDPRRLAGAFARDIRGGVMPMAMTGLVKDELSRVTVLKPCCRKAEVSALLRFAGGLHLAGGRIVVEAELDTGVAARRLRKDIAEVFGHSSDLIVLAPSGLRKGNRYVVRVARTGTAWPGRRAWWTTTAGRSAGCPGRSCRAPPATARPPGGARSWPTAP